jgi:hypothetical protein
LLCRSLLMSAVVLGPLVACDVERLESRAGDHLVYYWSPESHRLCGGTIEHADRLLEVMSAHYSLPSPGPASVSYFWVDRSLIQSCTLITDGACTHSHRNAKNDHAVSIVASNAVHRHELGHASSTQPNGGQPSFLSEGLANRWSLGPGSGVVVEPGISAMLSYSRLNALLGSPQIDASDYGAAALFWAWLEAEFGAEKMGALVRRLKRRSSVAEVEAAFVDIFGVTLEQAVVAHQGSPLFEFDDPACAMDLPRQPWTDAGIDLAGQTGACESSNFVNIGGRAGQVHLLELPEFGQQYQLTVEDTPRADVLFYPCLGRPRPYSQPTVFSTPSSGNPIPPAFLEGGLHAVYVLGDLDGNGKVVLPRVELRQP